jgi:GntR family transcriptional repressor for pyruvate dehydrogenase complex
MTIAQEIATKINEEIVKGTFPPGTKLPPERELTEIMCASRTSVREGLKMLKAKGILETHHGQGTYVTNDISNLNQALTMDLSLNRNKNTVLDLFKVRIVLESQIAAWSAEQAGDAELDEMNKILNDMESAIGKGENGAKQDILFHDRIARSTHNQAVLYIMMAIWDLLRDSRNYTLSIPGRSWVSLKAHREIYKAIKEKNPPRASQFMKLHLEEAYESVRNYLYP